MKRISKIFLFALLALVLSFAPASGTEAPEPYSSRATQYLTGEGWEPNVKYVINQLFDAYGRNSKSYNPEIRPYAVFDCDNTISLTDVQEQLLIFQAENLRYAVRPEDMYDILTTGIPDVNKDLGKDYGGHTIAEFAKDVSAAYRKLCAKGYVAPDSSRAAKKSEWISGDDWKEFAAKIRLMYDAIGDNYSVSVSYPWVGYHMAGMTPAEAERLAYESHKFYTEYGKKAPENWTKGKWESPKGYRSICGPVSVSFRLSTGVSDEMRELIRKLDANGIDVWINSASPVQTIRALLRCWGLAGVRDVVAMTYKIKDGVYLPEYDYDFHAQTQGVGKSETVVKIIAPLYNGRGPIFGAGDSQGDFNFMTEFKDTVCGLIINRQRKDDAGICSAVAVYQNEKGVDLYKAMESGDIRVLLQGRQENGGYFWPQAGTQLLGADKPAILSEKGEGWLELLRGGTSPRQLINDCVKLTGKLEEYAGVKTR